MKIIEGWAVWDSEAWKTDFRHIYPTKELAMEAAKKHHSYMGDSEEDYGDHMISPIKINLWFCYSELKSLIENEWGFTVK